MPRLTSDGWLLFALCGVRSFAFGFLSVILALYLDALGLDAAAIGGVFTAALIGGALITAVLTQVADRIGRRRLLILSAGLMSLAGAVFALVEQPVLLVVAAIVGSISPSGKDIGPFLAIEQAALAQTASDRSRTHVYSIYNLVGSAAVALGALASTVPQLLGLPVLDGYRALIWSYALVGLLLLIVAARLSSEIEISTDRRSSTGHWSRFGVHRSRGIVARFAGLQALDAFAGGFVGQSLLAYWFSLRYDLEVTTLGMIFFGTNLLSGLSLLAAAPIARRFGLLPTLVFTHLPSNILLILVPLMPNVELAVVALLARHMLSQLDVPTRQSYTMAIVEPSERSAAAGLNAIARNAASAAAPVFAGSAMAVPALGLPFLIAGGLKIIFDVLMLAVFRDVRPPEETRRLTSHGKHTSERTTQA